MQRRIHRYQSTFGRIVQGGFRRDHAIQHWFTVFGIADLEERILLRRFDEIACGVDLEQAHFLAINLPADDEADVKIDVKLSQCLRIVRMHFARGLADQARGFKHIGGIPQGTIRVIACLRLQ